MKQYFRYLSLLLLTVLSTQAFALDDIDRFAKKCDFYTEVGFGADSLAYQKKQRNELRRAGVPIRMSFASCEAIKYIIKLKNGSSVSLESAYPTNSDPDVKGSRYGWESDSPSPQFWYFTYGGWEDAGWVLIDKIDGRKIESGTDCSDHQIEMNANFLAVICSGAYENTTPTLYVLDFKRANEVWSNPVQIPMCNEGSKLVSQKFEFANYSTFILEGNCRLSEIRGNAIVRGKKWVKVKLEAQISEEGIHIKSNGLTEKISWQSVK